jgi:hypothetical protein
VKYFNNMFAEAKEKALNTKGVAGLEILLSVVVSLFLIGLVVMIFALMGVGLQNQTSNTSTAYTVIGTTVSSVSGVTSNFGIIILISSMVVLILLTVVIIRALRGAETSVSTG